MYKVNVRFKVKNSMWSVNDLQVPTRESVGLYLPPSILHFCLSRQNA